MWALLLLAQHMGLQQTGPRWKPSAQEKALATGTTSGASPEVMGKVKSWITLISALYKSLHISECYTTHTANLGDNQRRAPGRFGGGT